LQETAPVIADEDFPDVISTPSPIRYPKYKLKQMQTKMAFKDISDRGSIKSAKSF